MKTGPELIEKLQQLPEKFSQHFAAGRYRRACMDYEEAVLISKFIEMPEGTRINLLLRFPDEQVKEAHKKAKGWQDDDGKRSYEQADRHVRYVCPLYVKEGIPQGGIDRGLGGNDRVVSGDR